MSFGASVKLVNEKLIELMGILLLITRQNLCK